MVVYRLSIVFSVSDRPSGAYWNAPFIFVPGDGQTTPKKIPAFPQVIVVSKKRTLAQTVSMVRWNVNDGRSAIDQVNTSVQIRGREVSKV